MFVSPFLNIWQLGVNIMLVILFYRKTTVCLTIHIYTFLHIEVLVSPSGRLKLPLSIGVGGAGTAGKSFSSASGLNAGIPPPIPPPPITRHGSELYRDLRLSRLAGSVSRCFRCAAAASSEEYLMVGPASSDPAPGAPEPTGITWSRLEGSSLMRELRRCWRSLS